MRRSDYSGFAPMLVSAFRHRVRAIERHPKIEAPTSSDAERLTSGIRAELLRHNVGNRFKSTLEIDGGNKG